MTIIKVELALSTDAILVQSDTFELELNNSQSHLGY